MSSIVPRALVAILCLLAPLRATASPDERIQIKVDASEAEAALAIVAAARNEGQAIGEEAWRRLFATEPYVRLKKREASLHRAFTDEDFRKFVLSPELGQRAPELGRTLEAWRKADLVAAARRVRAYLPAEAAIRATVYLVIKPQKNSFVFEVESNPAIFLYLDPDVTAARFENTVSHELHHIGYASLPGLQEKALEGLAPNVRTAVEWMGAFGEGFAMLAAAGGPDVHPHVVSDPKDRARWDRDMEGFDQDLKTLDRFFLDVIEGKLKTKEEIDARAFSFFGVQGPWYTVGYRMAVVIERHDGRAALIACMSDPRKLLATYNRDAAGPDAKGGQKPAVWSTELLERIGAVKSRKGI